MYFRKNMIQIRNYNENSNEKKHILKKTLQAILKLMFGPEKILVA